MCMAHCMAIFALMKFLNTTCAERGAFAHARRLRHLSDAKCYRFEVTGCCPAKERADGPISKLLLGYPMRYEGAFRKMVSRVRPHRPWRG